MKSKSKLTTIKQSSELDLSYIISNLNYVLFENFHSKRKEKRTNYNLICVILNYIRNLALSVLTYHESKYSNNFIAVHTQI